MKLSLFISLLTSMLFAINALGVSPYSNGEGPLGSKSHDRELQGKINKRVLTNGVLDVDKLEESIRFYTAKRNQYQNDVYMNLYLRSIEDHNLSRKKAEKKARKRLTTNRRTLLAFDGAINLLKDLKSYAEAGAITHNPRVQKDIADLGVYMSLVDTYFQEDIDRGTFDQLRNATKLFYKFDRVNKDKDEASNLLKPNKAGFYAPEELVNLKSSGVDLSTIDPPSSVFWENTEVEKFNPNDETWKGHVLFPPKDQEQVLHYKRMADGTIKMKAYWLNKNEEEVDVTIRMQKEMHSGTLASMLVRALGYHAIPTVFRKDVKLLLGKTTFEEFLSHLDQNHDGAITDISNFVTSYDEDENSVMLRYIVLEAFPTKEFYRKMGPFRTGRNGFDNKREYRAMVMNGALLSLNDAKDRQTRADVYRETKTDKWRPLVFLSDLGYSMGSYLLFDNLSSVNDYVTDTTWSRNKSVTVRWLNSYSYTNFEQGTYSDARWWIRRARRLTSNQIYIMAKNSGYPEPVARLYGKKVSERINDYIKSFRLESEIGLIKTESYESIHNEFPEYVTKEGLITSKIDQEDNSNVSHIAYFGRWDDQLSLVGATVATTIVNSATELDLATLGLNNTTFNLGEGVMDFDVKWKKERSFKVNKNKSEHQRRFTVIDTYTRSVPVGSLNGSILKQDVGVTLPLNYHYEYTYTHYHTYDSVREAMAADFFKSFNPNRLSSIAKNLKKGEQVKLTKGHSFDIGTLKADATDHVSVDLNIVSRHQEKITEFLLTKSDDHVEISSSKKKLGSWKTGFDIKAILKLGIGGSISKRKEFFELNRVQLSRLDNGIDSVFIDNAFRLSFESGDASKLHKFSDNVKINIKSKVKNWHAGLFWWSKYSTSDFIEYDVESNIEEKLNRKAYVAREFKSSSRDFNDFYIEDFDFGAIDFAVDFAGTRIDESKVKGTSLEVVLTEDGKGVEDMLFNIAIVRNDNHATKKELQRDHLDYFSALVGEDDYFNFMIPKDVKYYSPLTTTQYWQISKKGLNSFITKFAASSDCNKQCKKSYRKLLGFEVQLTSGEDQKSTVKKLMAQYFNLVKYAIGKSGKKLKELRKYMNEKHYFVYTRLSDVNKYTVPVSYTKEGDLFGKPIGRYQGPSFLERFKRSHYLKHFLDVEQVVPGL